MDIIIFNRGDTKLFMNTKVILGIILNNTVDYSQSGIMIYINVDVIVYIQFFINGQRNC